MNSTTVYLIRLSEAARDAARRAAQEALPDARIVPARTVMEAARQPAGGRELVVLPDDEEAEVLFATQRLDAAELPRWAVVCLGHSPSHLAETVAPEDWGARMLGRVFRLVLLQHELQRENLQLRGDIKTIARRVSHDLRTPLSCIHTVCELLKEPTADLSSARQSAGIIRNAALEAGQVLDRVGALLKASTDPLPCQVISAGAAVAHALELLEPELREAGRKVRQPAVWPEVFGVSAWLETIWHHLIHNALRHGARSGPIQLGWDDEPRGVKLWIASQGLVPEPMRPRLLRPFNGLHADTGAGLGLSVVHRLVSMQGGRCGYRPDESGRALFWFTLPAAAPRPRRSSRSTAAAGR